MKCTVLGAECSERLVVEIAAIVGWLGTQWVQWVQWAIAKIWTLVNLGFTWLSVADAHAGPGNGR